MLPLYGCAARCDHGTVGYDIGTQLPVFDVSHEQDCSLPVCQFLTAADHRVVEYLIRPYGTDPGHGQEMKSPLPLRCFSTHIRRRAERHDIWFQLLFFHRSQAFQGLLPLAATDGPDGLVTQENFRP